MSIHITKTSNTHETVLRVDGQLNSDNITELNKERRRVNGPLVLDLSNFQSADTAGLETLQELISMGTRIRGASPYIELLLKITPVAGNFDE